MCKVKIHLFELSAVFEFVSADADRPAVRGRIIFSSRLDWSLPELALTSHGARRTGSNTSEFESYHGGLVGFEPPREIGNFSTANELRQAIQE